MFPSNYGITLILREAFSHLLTSGALGERTPGKPGQGHGVTNMKEEWVSPTFRRLTVGEDHVSYAYVQIGYESVPEGECGPEGLTQRWGGLDVEHFVRALQKG